MIRVSRADTASLREQCFRVRHSVFADELRTTGRRGFFKFLERDLYDGLPQTTHFLAFVDESAAGTLSLIRGTDPLGDCFGLPLGKRWRVSAPGAEAEHVAQVAQSSVLAEYQHLNVAVALWATVLRDAAAVGIQWFFAEVHLDSDVMSHGHLRQFPDDPEIRCTARHTNPTADTNQDPRACSDQRLPAIVELFARLGGRTCGQPHYCPGIKSYCTPFVWRLDELAEQHMSLLDRLPDFESLGRLNKVSDRD